MTGQINTLLDHFTSLSTDWQQGQRRLRMSEPQLSSCSSSVSYMTSCTDTRHRSSPYRSNNCPIHLIVFNFYHKEYSPVNIKPDINACFLLLEMLQYRKVLLLYVLHETCRSKGKCLEPALALWCLWSGIHVVRWILIKPQAHVKTLGKWFNDVYNKRELYSYSKRLSYMCIKTKPTKIQQTNASNLLCILIHILKNPTQSFSSMPPWLEALFLGFFSL